MECPDSFNFSITKLRINKRQQLGQGLTGKVCPAEDLVSGKKYAVKIMREVDQAKAPKIEEEIVLLKTLTHDNFIKFWGYDKTDTDDDGLSYYFIMELAKEDLQKVLDNKDKRKQFSELKNIHKFIYQMISVCQHFTSKTICHRDIKPGNILLCEGDVWKLADTGLAKVMSDKPTVSSFAGTISFMSPELIQGISSSDQRTNWLLSDVYSLGLVILRVCGYDDCESLNNGYDTKLTTKIEEAIKEVEKRHNDRMISTLLSNMLVIKPEYRMGFPQLWKLIQDNPLSTLAQESQNQNMMELQQKINLLEGRIVSVVAEYQAKLTEKDKEIANLQKQLKASTEAISLKTSEADKEIANLQKQLKVSTEATSLKSSEADKEIANLQKQLKVSTEVTSLKSSEVGDQLKKEKEVIAAENKTLKQQLSIMEQQILQLTENLKVTENNYLSYLQKEETEMETKEELNLLLKVGVAAFEKENSLLQMKLEMKDNELSQNLVKILNLENVCELQAKELIDTKEQIQLLNKMNEEAKECEKAKPQHLRAKVEELGKCEFTWNHNRAGKGITISKNGDTATSTVEEGSFYRTVLGDIVFMEGVYYWEIIVTAIFISDEMKIGVYAKEETELAVDTCFSNQACGFAYYGIGALRNGSDKQGESYGKDLKTGSVVGCFLDMNAGVLSFSLDGKYLGPAYKNKPLLKAGPIYPAVALLNKAGCQVKAGMSAPAFFHSAAL
jgi:serine/threonine protein kinase